MTTLECWFSDFLDLLCVYFRINYICELKVLGRRCPCIELPHWLIITSGIRERLE